MIHELTKEIFLVKRAFKSELTEELELKNTELFLKSRKQNTKN